MYTGIHKGIQGLLDLQVRNKCMQEVSPLSESIHFLDSGMFVFRHYSKTLNLYIYSPPYLDHPLCTVWGDIWYYWEIMDGLHR